MAQSDYPVGRYKLALIEPLLGNLFYYDLDEATVNVGIENCQCVLPFDAMELGQLLELIPENIQETPLAQLMYDTTSGRWSVLLTHKPDSDEEPDINNGEVFQVHLPANWGFFWFKVVDVLQEETVTQPGQQNETPGFAPSQLSMLPTTALQIIAGNLSKRDCLYGLILADPFVMSKLLRGVRWERFSVMEIRSTSILEAFRLLRLMGKDHVKKLTVVEEEALRPANQLLLEELSEVISAGASLEEVSVSYEHLALFRRPNKATKRLKVTVNYEPASSDWGSMLSKLASVIPPSNSTEIALDCRHPNNDPFHEPTSNPSEQRPIVLEAVTQLDYYWTCGPVPPFASLPNLTELSMYPSFIGDVERMNALVSSLSRSRLAHLLRVEIDANAYWIELILEALANVAPNVKCLILDASVDCSRADEVIQALLDGQAASKRLGSLAFLRVSNLQLPLVGNRDFKWEDVLTFFLEYKPVPAVKLTGDFLGKELPTKLTIRHFQEQLGKLGKIVEFSYVDRSGRHHDYAGSDADGEDTSGSTKGVHCHVILDFQVVVRNPDADVPPYEIRF